MTQPAPPWTVDPEDPRAPPVEVWEALTPEERAAVVASLPSDFPATEANPPEGDEHWNALAAARTTLTRWFRKGGRRVYVSGDLPVYYPGQRMFSPDVIAVLDVEPHRRESWIVSHEGGRGLDFAMEIIVSGRRRKDLKTNVEKYAKLGIAEYFVFDRTRLSLSAFYLDQASQRYDRQLAQAGRYASRVLGLELAIDGTSVRFSAGEAALPDSDELIDKLGTLMDQSERRLAELEAALEEEQRLREDAEAKLAALREELDRLRRER